MFHHVREQEKRDKNRKEREEEALEKAYQNANLYQRQVFDAFNGYRIKIGGKSVWFECEITSRGIYIRALLFNHEFKLFESHSSFEKRVLEIVRKRMDDIGYSGCPSVYFRYC